MGFNGHGHFSRLSLNSKASLFQPDMAACVSALLFPSFCELVFHYYNPNWRKCSSLSNTHLLSHSSIGQKSEHSSAGSSVQGSKVSSSKIADCFQTSIPVIVWLRSLFSCWLSESTSLSPPRVHRSLAMWPLHELSHTLNISDFGKGLVPLKGILD